MVEKRSRRKGIRTRTGFAETILAELSWLGIPYDSRTRSPVLVDQSGYFDGEGPAWAVDRELKRREAAADTIFVEHRVSMAYGNGGLCERRQRLYPVRPISKTTDLADDDRAPIGCERLLQSRVGRGRLRF